MADTLIFSRDRPAQLDLLLRSIDKFASFVYGPLSCLFIATDTDFEKGYANLIGEHPDIGWMREVDFEAQVRDWLAHAADEIAFLVDDDVFDRRAIGLIDAVPASPRAGDYDYPLSVDGCIYYRDDILPLLDFSFINPTQFESELHGRRGRYPYVGFASIYPCLIGVPANRVSLSSECSHMGIDLAELNRRYLAGKRISLAGTLCNLVESAPHVNLEYVWE